MTSLLQGQGFQEMPSAGPEDSPQAWPKHDPETKLAACLIMAKALGIDEAFRRLLRRRDDPALSPNPEVEPEPDQVPEVEPEPEVCRGHFREFVVTISDGDMTRYAAPGMTLDHVIEKEVRNIADGDGSWSDNLAVWEGNKMLALIRAHGKHADVHRFDHPTFAARVEAEEEPAPRQRGPIEPTARPPLPFAMGSMTLTPVHDPTPVSLEYVALLESPSDDERTACRSDLPRLQEAGWRVHHAGPLTVFVRVVVDF